jgi:hypothetical protein
LGRWSIFAATAGGTATMTRSATTTTRSDSTRTFLPLRTMRRTGERRTTRLPSWRAMRRDTADAPPTKRLSCAPPSVLIRLSKVSALCVYQRTWSSDRSRGCADQTASTPRSSSAFPFGVAAFACFQVSNV